ncbi:MAG: hypothetical protein PHT27_07200, partial [Candidatus Izemoplasmatales bacterium]|nr:hypothetical protein [Candidatus Izemoplasmatales bacterium]
MRSLIVFFLIVCSSLAYSDEQSVIVGLWGKSDVLGIEKSCSGFSGLILGRLKDISAEELAGYDIVIVGAADGFPDESKVLALRTFAENGGGVIIQHRASGYKWNEDRKILFPEIATGFDRSEDRKVIRKTNLPGFSQAFTHSYYDHIVLKAGKDGDVLFADADEYPVVVAGKFGMGKVLVSGMVTGLSCPPGQYSKEAVEIAYDGERDFLLDVIRFLFPRDVIFKKKDLDLRSVDIGMESWVSVGDYSIKLNKNGTFGLMYKGKKWIAEDSFNVSLLERSWKSIYTGESRFPDMHIEKEKDLITVKWNSADTQNLSLRTEIRIRKDKVSYMLDYSFSGQPGSPFIFLPCFFDKAFLLGAEYETGDRKYKSEGSFRDIIPADASEGYLLLQENLTHLAVVKNGMLCKLSVERNDNGKCQLVSQNNRIRLNILSGNKSKGTAAGAVMLEMDFSKDQSLAAMLPSRPEIELALDRNYYTDEEKAILDVELKNLNTKNSSLHLELLKCGSDTVLWENVCLLTDKKRISLEIPLGLKPGNYEIFSELVPGNGSNVTRKKKSFAIYKKAANELKIDSMNNFIYNGKKNIWLSCYCVPQGKLDTLSKAGFNRINFHPLLDYENMGQEALMETYIDYLDAAEACGLKVDVNTAIANQDKKIKWIFDMKKGPENAARFVSKLKSHPAVWSWKIMDEPDGIAEYYPQADMPEFVKSCALSVKEEDPYHPLYVTLAHPGLITSKYSGALDFLATDPYPIPGTIGKVSYTIRQMRNELKDKKPVEAVLQAFSQPPTFTFPSSEEIRAMTY